MLLPAWSRKCVAQRPGSANSITDRQTVDRVVQLEYMRHA